MGIGAYPCGRLGSSPGNARRGGEGAAQVGCIGARQVEQGGLDFGGKRVAVVHLCALGGTACRRGLRPGDDGKGVAEGMRWRGVLSKRREDSGTEADSGCGECGWSHLPSRRLGSAVSSPSRFIIQSFQH